MVFCQKTFYCTDLLQGWIKNNKNGMVFAQRILSQTSKEKMQNAVECLLLHKAKNKLWGKNGRQRNKRELKLFILNIYDLIVYLHINVTK